VVTAQRLFSVYLHTKPGFAFADDSIFAGHEIADRVEVQWAQWTVVSTRANSVLHACCAGYGTLSHDSQA
jgi:hypothetical protein